MSEDSSGNIDDAKTVKSIGKIVKSLETEEMTDNMSLKIEKFFRQELQRRSNVSSDDDTELTMHRVKQAIVFNMYGKDHAKGEAI